MIIKWLLAVTTLLVGGLSVDASPPPQSASSAAVKSSLSAAIEKASSAPAAKPAVQPAEKPKARPSQPAAKKPEPAEPTVDQFGFPLVIVINPPPVPPQLLKPSPPIKEAGK
ncbi:MAG: hypothetical protein ABFC96_05270 [Thermoguttaceae bacterium]